MKTPLELLGNWTRALPAFLRPSQKTPYEYYGTGESAHWPVQSNFNIFATLAVLGTHEKYRPVPGGMDPGLLVEKSLSLLRYGLSTHKGGAHVCTDGGQWGHSWISVLGLERMRHGVSALKGHLTGQDHALLKEVFLSEADWILDNHPVVAGIEAANNRPESNIWNGCHLFRSAMSYPDAPRREAYLEKATAFLLNGISVPSDATSTMAFRGKPLSQWHVGPNFTENYGLNHHGYLNVGYMVICLSNIAMLHFDMKEQGIPLPPEVYHHAEDLWKVVKGFTFADGRLNRIGGDTRARYCYCQDYAYPVWLLAADLFGDDTTGYESGWLGQLSTEMKAGGDGSFLANRLAAVRENSYFYFARLESDRALALSQAAYWGAQVKKEEVKPLTVSEAWGDDFHGAAAHRSPSRLASWVWRGPEGPALMCVPPGRSDMAEWQKSLIGEFRTAGKLSPQQGAAHTQPFPGGFAACGQLTWKEMLPMGEGEGTDTLVNHHVAAAALPDGNSMVVLQRASTVKDCLLTEVKSLGLKIPNDVWNGGKRHYRGEKNDFTARGIPVSDEKLVFDSPFVTIDNALTLTRIYGPKVFHIFRPHKRRIAIGRATPPLLGTLYADEVCLRCDIGAAFYPEGTLLIDDGFVVTLADGSRGNAPTAVASSCPEIRAVKVTCGETVYLFLGNFGEKTAVHFDWKVKGCQALSGAKKADLSGNGFSLEVEGLHSALYQITL